MKCNISFIEVRIALHFSCCASILFIRLRMDGDTVLRWSGPCFGCRSNCAWLYSFSDLRCRVCWHWRVTMPSFLSGSTNAPRGVLMISLRMEIAKSGVLTLFRKMRDKVEVCELSSFSRSLIWVLRSLRKPLDMARLLRASFSLPIWMFGAPFLICGVYLGPAFWISRFVVA